VDSVVGNSKNLKILGLEVKKIVEPSNVFTLPYLEFFNFENVKIKECVHTWANGTGYIHILKMLENWPQGLQTQHMNGFGIKLNLLFFFFNLKIYLSLSPIL